MSTVAAISTPLSASGLGVIRISGEEAVQIGEKCFRPFKGGKALSTLKGYSCAYGRVFDSEGDIDEAVATVFLAPKSYTGENTVELSCHGSPALLRRVLRAALSAGALPAGRGEFTKRAFLNGKLTLTQAEAVMNIISAGSQSAGKAALALRDGALYKKIRKITEDLTALESHLAAWSDYPEEDVPELSEDAVKSVLVGDIPIRLLDTAGIRETDDIVEKIGVDMANSALDRCDAVIAVFDSSAPLDGDDMHLIEKLKNRPVVAVINKSDLERQADIDFIKNSFEYTVTVSAAMGDGDEEFREALSRLLKTADLDPAEPVMANERQLDCARRGEKALEEGLEALCSGMTLDAVGICIETALDALYELTGEKASEAVIEQVFSRFCVGK